MSMKLDYDPKILEYLEALDKKYKCPICDGFLTCARVIECGHAFCAYCLDILESTKSTCPTCDHSIRPSVPAPQIDKEVEDMLRHCSRDLYSAYQKTKASRIEKQKERTKTLKQLADTIYAKEDKTNPSKPCRRAKNMEEVCTKLAEIVTNRPIADIIPECMINPKETKPELNKPQKIPSKPRSKTGLQSSRSARNEGLRSDLNTITNSLSVFDSSAGLDIAKVNSLFEMYNSLTQSPPDSGGSGDAEDERLKHQEPSDFPCSSEIENEALRAARQRIQQEIEFLDRETDEAVDLYQFVSKWTEQIRDVALGGREKQIEDEVRGSQKVDDGSLVPMTWMDGGNSGNLVLPNLEGGSPQNLDDIAAEELWKTSMQLIKRFRELNGKDQQYMDSGHQASGIDPSRLSIDPEWDKLELDMSIENVTKCMKTKFDEEFVRLFDGCGHIPEQSQSTSRSYLPTMLEGYTTEDGIEFFNKIMSCKSALHNLKDQCKSASNPQQIRNLLPVHEFQEPQASKSATNVSVVESSKILKSDLWIPEIVESKYQHYSKILQSRSGKKNSSAAIGPQSARLTNPSSLKAELKTPRTARSRPSSLPKAPERSKSGSLSSRTPTTPRLSTFKQ